MINAKPPRERLSRTGDGGNSVVILYDKFGFSGNDVGEPALSRKGQILIMSHCIAYSLLYPDPYPASLTTINADIEIKRFKSFATQIR
jgi:hypothetical protein